MAETRPLGWKAITAAAVLGLVLLLSGAASLANTSTHMVKLETDRKVPWSISGSISFRVEGGTITVGKQTIYLKKGDNVTIVLSGADKGTLHMGKDGEAAINGLPVEELYVNGELVTSNTNIDADFKYDVGSVKSTLKVEVYPNNAETKLEVDGEKIINGKYKGYIIVYDLAPTSSTNLDINLKGKHLNGAARGVEWNGEVIGIPEYPFLDKLYELLRH